jgi:hypothetical protein
LAQIAASLFVFSLFLVNLVPAIYVGDSPLFTTASYYLSTAHPSGYPLFATLGKLFTFLPFGSIGYRTNLVSAVFSTLSYFMLSRIIERNTGNRPLALSFALLPVFTPLVFLESVKAEAYALNAFISLLILYLGQKAFEERDFRFLYVVSFLFGLGSGNHHTLALLVFPAAVSFLVLFSKERRPSLFIWMALFFAAGFSINGQIALRSIALRESGFTYSSMDNFREFLDIFLRRNYGAGSIESAAGLGGDYSSFASGIGHLMTYVIKENFGLALSAIMTLSVIIFTIIGKEKKLRLYLFAAVTPWVFLLPKLTLAGVSPASRSMSSVSPYFLPVFFILPVFAAMVAGSSYLGLKRHLPKAARFAPLFLAVPLFYAPAVIQDADTKSNYLAYDRGRDMLNIVPIKGWLLVYGDNPAFTTFYMHWVERHREDIFAFNKVKNFDNYLFRRSIFWKNKILHDDKWTKTDGAGAVKYSFAPSKTAKMVEAGKVFAASHSALTTSMTERYDSYMGVLLTMLSPKDAGASGNTGRFSLGNYEKLNYERAAGVHAKDPLALEVQNHYGTSLLLAVPLINDGERADEIMGKALRLGDPEKFLPLYAFMSKKGTLRNPLGFFGWIEDNMKGTRMADVAHVTEYLLLKDTDRESAARKYAYLEENGLLIYLEDVAKTYSALSPGAEDHIGKP